MLLTSKFLLKKAVKPDERAKSQVYWHGTTKEAANSILREGLEAQRVTFEQNETKPQKGRIYLAKTLSQAMRYSSLRGDWRIWYIFSIPGDSLNDINIDEDALFSILTKEVTNLEKFKIKYDEDEYEPRSGQALLTESGDTSPLFTQEDLQKPVMDKIRDFLMSDPKIKKLVEQSKEFVHGTIDLFDKVLPELKRMSPKIPEDWVNEVAEISPVSITSDGRVWPDKLYIIKCPEDFKPGKIEDLTQNLWNKCQITIKEVSGPNKNEDNKSMKLQSKLLRMAYSSAVKKEIVTRFGKKPAFPKEEADIDTVLTHIENLCPQNEKTKTYMIFLAKQLFDLNPPGFVLDEDDARVKPLLASFDKAVKEKKLTGQKADIMSYPTLEDLENAVGEEKENTSLPGKTGYTPEQAAIIKKYAEILYEGDGWIVYRVERTSDSAKAQAAVLLCDNKLHGVSWCVGRGTTSYIAQGNFYVLERNGISKYAISSDSHSATIWNPADTPIWTTSGASGDMPNLSKYAQANGINIDIKSISALPQELIPVLRAVTREDKYLGERIPNDQLVEGDFSGLDKVVFKMPVDGLVEDLNKAFSSSRSSGLGAAVLGRVIKVNRDLKDGYPKMSDGTLVAYIELLAAAGYKKIPQSLEDYIIEEIKKQD